MLSNSFSPIMPGASPQLFPRASQSERGVPRVFRSPGRVAQSIWVAGRQPARILIRPQPGFYVMRLRSGAPLVTAIIYQLCPMVIPQPTTIRGPHPDDWCRPLDRSPRYEARLDGKRVGIDRVWAARSLRSVSRDEFEFRGGPLRRWARQNPGAPERSPAKPVDLGAIPPLF